MDEHLLHEWRRRVQAGDTVICLGDVAHPAAWRHRSMVLDLRECPGERLLILGNHDVYDTEALREAGFTDQCTSALCATEPPLALTHVPLRRVPPTAINVHGHLHGAPAPAPTPRHSTSAWNGSTTRPCTSTSSCHDGWV